MLFRRKKNQTSNRSEALSQALSRLDSYRHEIGTIAGTEENELRNVSGHRRCAMIRGDVARKCIAQSEEEILAEHNLLSE